MRPPACVSCKWGTGTTCEKQSNSASGKELEGKLKEMMAARTQQDAKWFAPPNEEQTKKIQNELVNKSNVPLFEYSSVDGTYAEFKSTVDYTKQSISSSEFLQNKRK